MKERIDNQNVVRHLRAAGLRPTRQRAALASLLFGQGDRHVSAEQLHSEAEAAGVRVSLATIYNTLHHFTRAGLLREVVVDVGRFYFDTNTEHHHHFYLQDEQRLIDIADSKMNVGTLPDPPSGSTIDRVDVVVRLKQHGRGTHRL